METWKFSNDDRHQIESLGLEESQVWQQIRLFKKNYFLELDRPCTIGDGILRIPNGELNAYTKLQESAAYEDRFQKFVPASGSASRMFHLLLQFTHQDSDEVMSNDLLIFIREINKFAFFKELQHVININGKNIDLLLNNKQYKDIICYLLNENGLNYKNQPKALLKFHNYSSGSRTALEEHLVEAAYYIKNKKQINHLHFTILREHEELFYHLIKKVCPFFENLCQSKFNTELSFQDRSSATIALDLNNHPFRDKTGGLLFRAGGHGALLKNLNNLQGDIVYIKNIDNVVPDRLKEPTIYWKKVLGGYLVQIQSKINYFLDKLTSSTQDDNFYKEIKGLVCNDLAMEIPLSFDQWSPMKRNDFLISKLDRPLRVCGMVKNKGEPGGGPFWVREPDGSCSLQIVEGAQVNFSSETQRNIWASATHFNPVDLVCAVRDYRGVPYNLANYVNSEAFIISQKPKNGQIVKALELPGLWNGSMSKWNTVFIEVPNITFNPVKNVLDLLRPEHQN